MSQATHIKQGIRGRRGQFSLHVLLVFATGPTIGSERAVVPMLGVTSFFVLGSFVGSFGSIKALLNRYAGK